MVALLSMGVQILASYIRSMYVQNYIMYDRRIFHEFVKSKVVENFLAHPFLHLQGNQSRFKNQRDLRIISVKGEKFLMPVTYHYGSFKN